MKIVCQICLETIALADPKTLALPLMGSMFTSPDQFHGVPDPFPPSVDWEAMRCPWCRNRPFLAEDAVLTDEGLYRVPKDAPTEAQEAQEDALACAVCGKTFGKRIALAGHMRSHQ